ncbi:MAG: geranylgeranylglycerol-phosphate geranylgeranyltransferase, partial [Bacteroidota bacterium]
VVALTQILIFYRVLRPSFNRAGIENKLNDEQFFMLLIATVLVTAGGYVMNDLLDAETDEINRPGTNPMQQIGRDLGRWTYLALVLIGFTISFFLALWLDELHFLWLYPLAVALLALYSRHIKPIPFAGNLLVGLYCAAVPAIIGLAERSALTQLIQKVPEQGQRSYHILLVFALFAFLATLIRELVKDMQDINGDQAVGRRTLPIVWGMAASRWLALGFSALTLIALLTPIVLGWPSFQSTPAAGLVSVLALGLVFIAYRILQGRTPEHYGSVSTLLKVFLLAGLGLLILL